MNGRMAVHAHNLAAWQYAVLAARGTGAIVVYTQHGMNKNVRGGFNRWRTGWLCGHTRALVAVTPTTADHMAVAQGFHRARIEVIPNGIDPARCGYTARSRIEARRMVGLPENAFIVGSVGRFVPEKNYPLLVEAFKTFSRHLADEVLVLVGDGPEREKIECDIRSNGIERQCRLPGIQADPVSWISTLDVFCLSSISEGMPVSLLEAAACGVPSVVTDVGGNAAIVVDGVTGLVVPPDDPGAMAAAFAKLRREPELGENMGGEARRRLMAMFTSDVTLAAYERRYAAAGQQVEHA